MKKVSIIIPTYNSSEWIERCLISVTNQTYANVEIIISDDGSTDNTLDIVRSFGDERIRIIESEHGGDAHARNEALRVATGEYLMFVDSDDMITRNRTEILINTLDKNEDIAFVVTNWRVVDAEDTIVGNGYAPPKEKWRLFVQCLILFGGSMHRREGFGLFDETFPVYSDWVKLLERGEYKFLEEPYYYRRIHKNRLSQEYLGEKQIEILKYRRKIWHRFKEQIPKEIWDTLNTGENEEMKK